MAALRGRVFEKLGVNVSTVHGTFSEAFRAEIPGAGEDPRFWASGISVIAHPRSPLVPAAHMNTRHVATGRGMVCRRCRSHPVYPEAADTDEFHRAMRAACDAHDPGYYGEVSRNGATITSTSPTGTSRAGWVAFSSTI